MKKRKLGTTDLFVTPVAFGVLTMGGSQMDLPLQEGAKLIRYAIDKGIKFLRYRPVLRNLSLSSRSSQGHGSRAGIRISR